MATSQTEEAVDHKPEPPESETVQESGGEKSDSQKSSTAGESQILELSTESFKAFCDDISAMFSIGMKSEKQEATTVKIEVLKERFKNLTAVTSAKVSGALEGTFQIIFSKEGLFTLAGAIAMPAQMTSLLEKCVGPEKTMQNIKSGSLKEAQQVSDTVAEACNLLIGSWDRIFREGLEGHKHLLQTNTFIGDPWDNPKEKIGLESDEEFVFASYKMTISPFPAFVCGVIFPKKIFAKVNAEAEVKAEVEAKAKAEAEEKAKVEAEEKAKVEAEEKAKAEAEEKAKAEAEEKAKAEAEEKAKAEAEAKAKAEVEEKAKAEAEEKAKAEAEEKAKAEAEEKAKAEAEEKAKAEVEEKAKAEAEEKAKAEVEEKAKAEAEEKAKAEAEEKAKAEAEEKAETKPEAADEQKAEPEAKTEAIEEKDKIEEQAEQQSEEKPEAKVKTEEKATEPEKTQEPPKGKVSETIQKMTQSPAILPGESGGSTTANISFSSNVCATDIMQKKVAWATSEESVQQALTKMQQQDSGYIMIGKDEILEGIVSKSDISGATSIYLRPIFAKWYGPLDDATLQIKLKWIMSRPVRTVRPETPLAIIIENMCRFGGRCLPVVDEQGKVKGLITVFDIFRTLLNTSESVATVGKTTEAPALV